MSLQSEQSPRVAVVTGASSGIGKVTAVELVRQGWQVIGVGRNPQRCAQAETEIRAAASGHGQITFIRGDFDRMSEVLRVAEQIQSMTPRLDLLINNAGGVRDRIAVTADGIEATFAANHLAPFLLTRQLLPLLRATARTRPGAVRVIAVSSSGHRVCNGFDWSDPQKLNSADASPVDLYCQAKLANLLFTRELARRVAADGIVAQAMHPGVVDTNFGSHGDESMQAYMKEHATQGPEAAAKTLVWMATAAEAGSKGGRYFHDMQEEEPAPQALDDIAASRLWEESERLLAAL